MDSSSSNILNFNPFLKKMVEEHAANKNTSPDLLIAGWVFQGLFSEQVKPIKNANRQRINGKYAKESPETESESIAPTDTEVAKPVAKKRNRAARSRKRAGT